MTAMLGLWTPTARASAEKSFGEAHWRFFIYGRLLLRALPLLAVAAAVVGVVIGVRAAAGAWSWPDVPGSAVVFGAATLAALVMLVRRVRSPYRIPRRRLWSRY